jgi:outer membrane protein OmpA-like peptidoglycan-associated protein
MPALSPFMPFRSLFAVVVLTSVLVGCAQKPRPEPVPVNVPPAPARTTPAPNSEVVTEFKRRGFEAREAEEGVVIYLPTVYLFEFNKAAVEPDARKHLRQIAEVLNDQILTGRHVIVEGHADAIGTGTYNMTLSERRAEAVIAELVAAGVDKGRLAKRAFGKERPLEPNKRPDGSDNPEGRARNRRVALIVENPTPAESVKD